MRGLYVHIPFCTRKCLYCDFYSLPGRTNGMEPYVDAVLSEAKAYGGMVFQTLYIGGGTPSLLGGRLLTKLIAGLNRAFDLTGMEEATVELNPDSTNTDFLKAARENGINRVSLGVQSLDDAELKASGRIHTASQAIDTLRLLRESGFKSVSADIIAGLPGQSLNSLRLTTASLLKSGVSHVSLYCLSLEHGTPLAENPPRDLPGDDEQAELFENAAGYIRAQDFVHYEISNFARQGHQCIHNLNYWKGGEYLGLGPSAASHLGGKRFRNRPDLDSYLKNPSGQAGEFEELNVSAKAAEEAMLRLRLINEGIDSAELVARFGRGHTENLINRLHEMAKDSKLIAEGSKFRLPPSRILTSNPIFAEVLS